MPPSGANRNPHLKSLWWSCAVLLLFALLAVAFIRGIHFNVASRSVQFACQPIQPGNNQSLFFHLRWDGPTGQFTSGDNYGFRVWKWYLRLDIINDPIAAAKRGLPTSVKGLIAAMDSKDHWRRVCALHRLAELRETATPAIPALLKQLARDDAEAHETLAAISTAAPTTAVPLLTNALMTGDVTTRCHIVEVLTDIGPPASAAIAALTGCLGDPEGKVVLRCAYALSKIGGRAADAVPALRRLLSSPDAELRAGGV